MRIVVERRSRNVRDVVGGSKLPRAPWVGGRPEGPGVERVATRVSAYLYGDVLVLASLIALRPEDLTGTTGLAYVLGTALSTYVAHVLAEAVG